jgi:hypothetical protein
LYLFGRNREFVLAVVAVCLVSVWKNREFVLAVVAVCLVSIWKKQGICISDCGSLSCIYLEETCRWSERNLTVLLADCVNEVGRLHADNMNGNEPYLQEDLRRETITYTQRERNLTAT